MKDVVAGYHFTDQRLLATGTPVLLGEINSYLQGGMLTLGLIALLVMVVVLAFAFRVRLRLLPSRSWLSGPGRLWAQPDTSASLSPCDDLRLSDLHRSGSRFRHPDAQPLRGAERRGGHTGSGRERRGGWMGPPLLVAMAAGAFGFLALRLSPVPMIRDFGLLLGIGVVVLVVAAVLLPATILLLMDRRRPRAPASTLARTGSIERGVRRLTTLGVVPVVGVLAVGVVVAAAGFAVEGRMPIETQPERWVSPTSSAVRDLTALRNAIGFSDELGIVIRADDVTSDEVVEWMYHVQTEELKRHPRQLLQAASMPGIAADVVGMTPTGNDVRTLLDIAPRDIEASLVSADRHATNLVFPAGAISLTERNRLIESIGRPPR